MVYTNEILTLAVEIGDSMLRNGAEIYRVEDTVVHILKSYEVKEFDVYVISQRNLCKMPMKIRKMPAVLCAMFRLVR